MISPAMNLGIGMAISLVSVGLIGVNRTVKTVSSLAAPFFVLEVISNIPRIAADKYTKCVDSCDRWESEVRIICNLLCLIFASRK